MVCCGVLLASCSPSEPKQLEASGPRKGPVVLECKGVTTYPTPRTLPIPPRETEITYRIDTNKKTFETWTGERFHKWDGVAEVDDYQFRFKAQPTDQMAFREVVFIRDNGEATDTVEFQFPDGNDKNVSELKCVVVDKPKPAPRMF